MNRATVIERPGLEARLAALRPGLDLLGMPACILDLEHRYRYVNRAYATHTGRPLETFAGRGVDELFPRPLDARRAHLDRALAAIDQCIARRTRVGDLAAAIATSR